VLVYIENPKGHCHSNSHSHCAFCRWGGGMKPLSFKRHRFTPAIIRYAIWLYVRLTLSFRAVEELLAERGVDVS
jgi:hypothetical protein